MKCLFKAMARDIERSHVRPSVDPPKPAGHCPNGVRAGMAWRLILLGLAVLAAFTGLAARAAAAPWNRFELAGPGSAALRSQIASVSRVPNSMELWWIGGDGSVQGAYYYEGGQWTQYTLAPAGSASPYAGIAAVSRISTSMEVWWIGQDGSVQDAYWYEGQPWQRFQLAPPGSAEQIGSGITAVSRSPSHMEVFWITYDGSVQDANYYDGVGWNQFQLAPRESATTFNGGITAVSRIPNSMEVWWIGYDGSVQDAYYYDGGGWNGFQLAPPGSADITAGITAVSRIPSSMEVWWIGPDGSVQDAYYYDGGGWNQFQLAPPGSAEASNGRITAVSRFPKTFDVMWIGPDHSVQDAYWYEGNPWQRFQLAPPGSASTLSGIKAVSRTSDTMEIWWVGPDGSVQDAYYYDTTVAAPSSGLGSNSNYIFYSDCNPLTDLSVTIHVRQDIVCQSASGPTQGFSFQLNAYSPFNETSAWQQYVIALWGNELVGAVDNWPLSGPNIINDFFHLAWLPSSKIPAGYALTISLENDGNGNITGATYVVTDDYGHTLANVTLPLLSIPGVTRSELAPIIAFELNLVGPVNSESAVLSSGAGTIVYTASSALTVLNERPACAESDYITAETANSVYGVLPANSSGAFKQTFSVSSGGQASMLRKQGHLSPGLNFPPGPQ